MLRRPAAERAARHSIINRILFYSNFVPHLTLVQQQHMKHKWKDTTELLTNGSKKEKSENKISNNLPHKEQKKIAHVTTL
jgi:2'-5' RNA ligase